MLPTFHHSESSSSLSVAIDMIMNLTLFPEETNGNENSSNNNNKSNKSDSMKQEQAPNDVPLLESVSFSSTASEHDETHDQQESDTPSVSSNDRKNNKTKNSKTNNMNSSIQVDNSDGHSPRRKGVAFHKVMKVYLIPTRSELAEGGLKHELFYSKRNMRDMKDAATVYSRKLVVTRAHRPETRGLEFVHPGLLPSLEKHREHSWQTVMTIQKEANGRSYNWSQMADAYRKSSLESVKQALDRAKTDEKASKDSWKERGRMSIFGGGGGRRQRKREAAAYKAVTSSLCCA